MLHLLLGQETGTHPTEFIMHYENSRRIMKLDVSKYQEVQKIHTGGVNSLDLDSTENRHLLSGSADGIICIYDLQHSTGSPNVTYPAVATVGRSNKHRHKFSIETVQWYPFDTGLFITSGMDKLLKVWDANALKPAEEYEFSGGIYCHHLSSKASNRSLIAIGSQSSKVKIVDLRSGSNTHTLFGHKQQIFTVQWSCSNENLLASGSGDNKVLLWDVRHAKANLMALDQHIGNDAAGPKSVRTAHSGRVNGLCFTSDGQHLLSYGTDDKLRLWDVATGQNTNVNYGRVSNGTLKGVKLSTNNGYRPETVFVPSENNIRVYNIRNGKLLNILRGHYNLVNCCLYNYNQQELYSGGNDRSILIWCPVAENVISYENYLREKTSEKGSNRLGKFTQRIAANADNWSSDED